MDSIEWVKVDPGRVWIGDNRGSLMHVANGPHHEIKIEFEFEISSEIITFSQWAKLTGQPAAGNTSDETLNRLTPLMVEGGLVGLDAIRLPSEAEWALADAQGLITRGDIEVELLADRPPRGGYWGAPCDGRPWTPPMKVGGLPDSSAHITRVWRKEHTLRGATPRNVSRPQMGFRLVRVSKDAYKEEPQRLPTFPRKSELLVRESIIAFLIGIIPSFTWAWFNASRSYLSESWLNIAVGGIFFSLMTAFIWRPKTPSYRIGKNCGKVKRVR